MPRVTAAGDRRIIAGGSVRRVGSEGVGVLLIFEGDSLQQGNDAETLAGPIPDRMRAALQPRRVRNLAIGGSTVTTATARSAAALALWEPGALISIGLGANDLQNQSSATTYLTGLKAYADLFLNAKFRVTVRTILSRTDGGPNFDTVRATANTEIRNAANLGVHWHGVEDWAADPIMGVDQAPIVYPDLFDGTVHPSAAGYALLAPYTLAAISSLIFSPVVNPRIYGGSG